MVFYKFLILVCVMVCAGCQSTRGLSPRETFLVLNGSERKNYIEVYETSPEALVEIEKMALRMTKIIVTGARDASLENPTGSEAVLKRLGEIDIYTKKHKASRIDELKKQVSVLYDPKTDVLLFYKYRTNKRQEDALVVMQGKKIKTKLILEEFSEPDAK